MPAVTYQYNFGKDELCHLMECEDFSPNTIITVQYGQQAVLLKDGVAVGESFLEGRHVLNSTVLDSIKDADRHLFGASTFHAKLYYVNIDRDLTLPWGTKNSVPFNDPLSRISTSYGAYGKYSIAVNDAKQFILKTIGQMSNFNGYRTFSKFDIQGFIAGKCQEIIISTIAKTVREQNISAYDFPMHLMEMSDKVRQELDNNRVFYNYGFTLKNFSIENISVPEDDLERIKNHFNKFIYARDEENIRMMKEQNDLALKRQEQYDSLSVTNQFMNAYEAQSRRQVLTEAASNQATGEGMNLGLGLVYAQSVGQAIGGMMNGMNNSYQQPQGQIQPGYQQTQNPGQPDNQQTPQPVQQPVDDMTAFKAKVEKLNVMKQAGLITEEEFNQMKTELLKSIM